MIKAMVWGGLALATASGLSLVTASAMNMSIHNAKAGCPSLVKQVHPDLKGKERGAEIKKCNQDPESYNKAAGF